eukprot:403348835
MYKVVIVPSVNPDQYTYLKDLISSSGTTDLIDQSYLQNYLKNLLNVQTSSDGCSEAFQKGVYLRGNYDSQFKSGNNSNKCQIKYRGSSAEQTSEVKAIADMIKNSATTFGTKATFVLFLESIANTTLNQVHMLMKPYAYDSAKEVSNFNKYYSLQLDSISYFQQPLTFGNHRQFFGTVAYGEPMDWLADSQNIESYTYFMNNMNGYLVPIYQEPSLSSSIANFDSSQLVTLNLKQMGYFYDNTLDILRRQGPYITIQKLLLTECNLNRDKDPIGYCSGKYRSNDGTGERLQYIDHSILWQLAVGLKNSGTSSFSNIIDAVITFQLKFKKDSLTDQNGKFYLEKVINATILEASDSYYIRTGRPYGIMNEFYFTQISQDTIEFNISQAVFQSPYSRVQTNLMFVFRDLTYKGQDETIDFQLNIKMQYPQFINLSKILFSQDFTLSNYKRDYESSKILEIQKIGNFAFAGVYIVITLICMIYILQIICNREERDSFRKDNPVQNDQNQLTEQNTMRGMPLLGMHDTMRDFETNKDPNDQTRQSKLLLSLKKNQVEPAQDEIQLNSSQELKRSADQSNRDLRDFMKTQDQNQDDRLKLPYQDIGAETEIGDNLSEINMLSSFPDFKKSLRQSMDLDAKQSQATNQNFVPILTDLQQVVKSEEDFKIWQQQQIEQMRKSRKEQQKKKQNPQQIIMQVNAKQRARDYNLTGNNGTQNNQDEFNDMPNEELSRISEKQQENSVDISMAIVQKNKLFKQVSRDDSSRQMSQIMNKEGTGIGLQNKKNDDQLNLSEIQDDSKKPRNDFNSLSLQPKFDIKGNLGNAGNFRRRQNNLQILDQDDNNLLGNTDETDILNRSFRNRPNQPLVTQKANQNLNKSVEIDTKLQRQLERTKKQEMQDEDHLKMRQDRQNLKYFINSGLFGGGASQTLQSMNFNQTMKHKPGSDIHKHNHQKSRESSYIEVSSVFSEAEEDMQDQSNNDGVVKGDRIFDSKDYNEIQNQLAPLHLPNKRM